jgi:hypothetical protein
VKREDVLVLVDDVRRDLLRGNFAENTAHSPTFPLRGPLPS